MSELLCCAAPVERAGAVYCAEHARLRGVREMRQDQIVTAFVRGAAWTLMRRSPTWLLLVIVVAAWLMAGHQIAPDLRKVLERALA
jgi:hypothetical protein